MLRKLSVRLDSDLSIDRTEGLAGSVSVLVIGVIEIIDSWQGSWLITRKEHVFQNWPSHEQSSLVSLL